MKKKLYIVRITHLVLAATELEAQNLACSEANHGDVECVGIINDLYDLPIGSDQVSAHKILVTQIAADRRFKGFEVQACMTTVEDERGAAIREECDNSDATLWSIYGQLVTGGLECIGDFKSQSQAEDFRGQILEVQGLWAQADEYYFASGTRPTFSEDAYLESIYEDRVSGGNFEDF